METIDAEDSDGNIKESPLDRLLGSMFAPLDNGTLALLNPLLRQ